MSLHQGAAGRPSAAPHPLVAATHAWRTAELGTTPRPSEDSDPRQPLRQKWRTTHACLRGASVTRLTVPYTRPAPAYHLVSTAVATDGV